MKARKIDTLVFTGLAGDYCVAWNMEDALTTKFKVVAVNEAIRAINNEAYTEKRKELEAKGAKFVNAMQLPKTLTA